MKRFILILLLLVSGCSDEVINGMWTVRARRAAQQLCQATDLHEFLQSYAESPKMYDMLSKFCTSVGWPLELNQNPPMLPPSHPVPAQ